MTWHLKDRELEKQLIELDPNFLENLDEAMYQFSLRENEEGEDLIGVDMEIYRSPRFITAQLQIEKTDIEKIADYNPNNWNNYPEVTPPEGVPMRVECFSLIFRKLCRTCAIYFEGKWYGELDGECNCLLELGGMMKVKRFRPWSED